MFDLELDWDRPARSGAQPTQHVLRVRLRPTRASAQASGLPLRLAIALDTSSSMAGARLARAQEACRMVIDQLRPEDRLWLAGYSGEVMPLLSALPGGGSASDAAGMALNGLQALGVTRMDLALDWIRSVLPMEAGTLRTGILITDGHGTDFTGKLLEDTQPLLAHADALKEAGISLYTVGFGDAANFNTAFLVKLADQAQGGFLYADTPEALEPQLQSNLVSAQAMAVEEAHLAVRLQSGAHIRQCCRIRPDYLPLDAPPDQAEARIALGALRADLPTDLLLAVEVEPMAGALPGNRPVLELRMEMPGQAATPVATAELLETPSYTLSQQLNADVDNDRLYWDLNTYSSALASSDNTKRTAHLLSRIEVTATRAGQSQIAEQAAQQLEDLQKTGKLNAHRATGLLTTTRKLGGTP